MRKLEGAFFLFCFLLFSTRDNICARIKVDATYLKSRSWFRISDCLKPKPEIVMSYGNQLRKCNSYIFPCKFLSKFWPEGICQEWLGCDFICFSLESFVKLLWGLLIQNVPARASISASFKDPTYISRLTQLCTKEIWYSKNTLIHTHFAVSITRGRTPN